ncbi:hypothetical protein BY996DRAFT_6425483 [Phakopsora pachyrhizi]|nr:hypothetical protein BY996DRAFT_6425483 [Phakopsora pachyrhizi]
MARSLAGPKLISSLQDDCERLGKVSKAILSNSGSRDRLELLGQLNNRPTTPVLSSPNSLAGDSPPQDTSETRQLTNRQTSSMVSSLSSPLAATPRMFAKRYTSSLFE